MIRVILESSAGKVVEIGREGNEAYLCQSDESRFPLLSQLDNCSYDVFDHTDMPQLLTELHDLAPDDFDHIREIISLAVRCRDEPGNVLSFTPFLD